MQTTSELYKTLLANNNAKFKTTVVIAGETYTDSSIVSLSVNASLYSKNVPAVGGATSREIDLKIIPGDVLIPRMAEIKVYVSLVLDNQESELIQKGTFYIDTRRKDTASGALVIHGYDAMLKMEKEFLEDEEDLTGWPKTMPEVIAEIAEKIGVELDDRNVLHNYSIEAPVGYTMREVAGWIAAAHAGNWTITDAGKLRLVPLYSNILTIGYLADESGNAITFGGVKILV